MRPFRFYLGTHLAGWVGNGRGRQAGQCRDVPLFISFTTLRTRKTLPEAVTTWAMDSGGFTEIATHGRFRTSPEEYVDFGRRAIEEMGGMDWMAPQDWMCEPPIVAKTGLSVEAHQELTVQNLLRLRELGPDLPIIPVLQGWEIDDYHRHVDLYASAGIDLTRESTVGIGSVCRRQDTDEIASIVSSVAARGISLHGFGVKTKGLEKYARHLVSADSMAWSFQARLRGRPLMGCTEHKNCANCVRWALHWRGRMLDRVTGS